MSLPRLSALCVFWLLMSEVSAAQSIFFMSPEPNDVLEPIQDVVIGYEGDRPERIELFVNGSLNAARTEPPFVFRIGWDPQQSQHLKAVASYPNGSQAACRRAFRGIRVDVEQTVKARQYFPFWEPPDASTAESPHIRARSSGTMVTLEDQGAASRFELHLIVVLDVSGSMMPFTMQLQPGVGGLVSWVGESACTSNWLIFDGQTLAVPPAGLASPELFRKKFRGNARSTIWDAVAAACQLFSNTPRRLIILISDGYDDGSSHDATSVEVLLKSSQASLVWVNPTTLNNRDLRRLARRSGGFVLPASDTSRWWSDLRLRIEHQGYVMITDPPDDLVLETSKGRLWYPRWKSDQSED